MGITIHFEGKVRDQTAYQQCLTYLNAVAQASKWPTVLIREEVRTLARTSQEQPWDYTGPTKGLILRPHPNADPFRFEVDENLYLQEYCKTQFAPIEIHLKIVSVLKNLQTWFESFYVLDEGQYFETEDLEKLKAHRERVTEMLDSAKEKEPQLQGPYKNSSGRIIDLIHLEPDAS